MEIIPFGSADLDNILAREPQRAEYLPFGAVLLDRTGTILKYNRAEGGIANRNPADVIGKNFFNEIAPCAKGKRFHGEFLRFHQTGQVNVMFDYKFAYKGANVGVKIHMKSQPDGQSCWLFVKRV
ncbi:photoactive yellow protein [Cereibacter sphaeroides]|jgi:photoactive yellow protein|uniref:Photoactive yellow protein n=2 Tax=Cereibacter sphaeroides TaxID=1063 RepID=PYP_CERS4|nr:photoactive yellow protein [Cereibacter sphaeroides]Q53226.1 RecName: Full=Photoactive yellow protein; Short=PYP [Cereibacter sphaeroides 2.4.1]ABN78764.1 photoactive yellow protein [Cereibacter sphaeroides ATCC 17029]AZB57710.1 photoactive yellow protein [Cereibacter sphaeroides]AZB65360.1 photoactive yellow protein [Cereibacter sphaeroides]AZB70056.1 photoactive yellow protein [Cereibacter sphaeroides]MWP38439.1 photoactive yellow protein [Cereibacter sphaeroides]